MLHRPPTKSHSNKTLQNLLKDRALRTRLPPAPGKHLMRGKRAAVSHNSNAQAVLITRGRGAGDGAAAALAGAEAHAREAAEKLARLVAARPRARVAAPRPDAHEHLLAAVPAHVRRPARRGRVALLQRARAREELGGGHVVQRVVDGDSRRVDVGPRRVRVRVLLRWRRVGD